MRERMPYAIGLALLALAILVGSVAIANGIRDRAKNDVLSVTGSAKARITSDYAIWDISVSSQNDTPKPAARQLAGWSSAVQSFLTSHGFGASELTVQPISTQTVEAADGSTIIGYQLTRTFEVRSSRVAAVAAIAEESSALIAAGIPIAAQPLQYVYTKLSDLRPRLIAEATKDAEGRADVLVKATGSKLGKLRSVDIGVFQVTAPNSTQVSDYGEYDTSTLQKDVTAVVNVTFAFS